MRPLIRSLAVSFGFAGIVTSTILACSDDGGATGSSEDEMVSDILSMTKREDGRFDVICTDHTREIRTAEEIQLGRVCNGVDAGTDAAVLDAGADGAAGGDAAADAAAARKLGTIFGRTDSCEPGQAIMHVKEDTNCMSLSNTNSSWSVSVQGQGCKNIPDTTVRGACMAIKPGTYIYGTTDTCEGSQVVMEVLPQTDCFSLSRTEKSWSVSVNGTCSDIPDTTVLGACLALKPGGSFIYGTTDSCDAAQIVMPVTPETDCLALSRTEKSWSISVNGTCSDIPDTNFVGACLEIQNRL